MLVELKNGDTYNGRLDNCDSWMNIKLKDVIFTSRVRGDDGRTVFGASGAPWLVCVAVRTARGPEACTVSFELHPTLYLLAAKKRATTRSRR